jgi:hypothetical protein
MIDTNRLVTTTVMYKKLTKLGFGITVNTLELGLLRWVKGLKIPNQSQINKKHRLFLLCQI